MTNFLLRCVCVYNSGSILVDEAYYVPAYKIGSFYLLCVKDFPRNIKLSRQHLRAVKKASYLITRLCCIVCVRVERAKLAGERPHDQVSSSTK